MAASYSTQIIEVEAASLPEAKKKATSQVPAGLTVLSETVVSDGEPRVAKGIAETTDEALAKATSDIPSGADVGKKNVVKPGRETVAVEAYDEAGARAAILSQRGETATVETIKLTTPGSKGVFGFGRKPNQYEVVLARRASVDITYQVKAKVRLEVGNLDEVRKGRAIDWWKGQGAGSKKCSVCSAPLSGPDGGYLLNSDEVGTSGRYLDYVSVPRTERRLGVTSKSFRTVQQEIVFKVENLKTILLVKMEIFEVKTPWLVCADCLGKYFTKEEN